MGSSPTRAVSRSRNPKPPLAMTAVALFVALALLAALQPASAAETQGQEKVSPCCFSNPSYDRICQVDPVGDETCDTILAYLNNPLSTGKTYCDNTKVRGGWIKVDCEQSQGQKSGQGSQASQSR